MQKKIYYGAAYYPELWDNDVIDDDIRIMKETGINVVRMGEFAWANMEPEQDKISLDFFVIIINKLYDNGIETVMCTPTPTPPIWISHGHPERMFVDQDGYTMIHGARQHPCTNNPFFRERSRIITEALAKAVGKLPGVVAWQTDNEFKCHVSECMCETCKIQWHEWLKKKYGTINNLNKAWGAAIWSEQYNEFEQVPQPLRTPFLHNSSLSTAYRMFSIEKIAEFQKEQVDIIKKHSDAPVTHNSNMNFRLDNELMFKDLDFASFDLYPDCDSYMNMIMHFDMFRNVKQGKPFWLMETSTSHNGNLKGYCKTHRNGFVKAEAVAAYASGALGFSYWLWRQQRSGCEQPHGSVLSAWGKPTVGYRNVLETKDAIENIKEHILATTPCQAELAITYSARARAFLLTEPLENLNYVWLISECHKRVSNIGIHRDLIGENAVLKGYKILLTPFMPYVSKEYLENARKFVEDGGIWIVGPLTGGRTGEHTVHTDYGLGELETIAGVETLFSYPMSNTGAFGNALGMTAPLGLWSTVFKPAGAKVIGVVEGGVTSGEAFLTEHKAGKGKIVMLGSMPQGEQGDTMLKRIIGHYADECGICHRFDVSQGTVVVPRKDDICEIWFVINMDGYGGSVTVPKGGTDLITGQSIPKCSRIDVESYGYRIIKLAH